MTAKALKLMMTERAYLPEAFAYQRYLAGRGWTVDFVSESARLSPDDRAIKFMGFEPAWRPLGSSRIIHEYQSRSTGSLSAQKDLAKSWLSAKPAARIFLNDYVKRGFRFPDKQPFLFRDMAVDEGFYRVNRQALKRYDVIYCGSIDARPGLIEAIEKLDQMGLTVLVVGSTHEATSQRMKRLQHTVLHGRATREAIPDLYATARFGLNFTPNIVPYSEQTSTKTLEYLAAGLGVLSNQTAWALDFDRSVGGTFLWLEDVHTKAQILDHAIADVDMTDFEWSRLLDRGGFEAFLLNL